MKMRQLWKGTQRKFKSKSKVKIFTIFKEIRNKALIIVKFEEKIRKKSVKVTIVKA